ncbi:hypothetical protein IEQ34_012889 [Dendrobium chrysotoxum]|uniref:Uncharacterized protein n=1 Tax=Dendrobium chrysotoxum TaxID=161865 RepID=A0AAV7G6V7_DENCH|nr:hypothetical protein IEQ34_012889 [Dendrobium chrysotoxum]
MSSARPPPNVLNFTETPLNTLSSAESPSNVRNAPDHRLMSGLPLDHQLLPELPSDTGFSSPLSTRLQPYGGFTFTGLQQRSSQQNFHQLLLELAQPLNLEYPPSQLQAQGHAYKKIDILRNCILNISLRIQLRHVILSFNQLATTHTGHFWLGGRKSGSGNYMISYPTTIQVMKGVPMQINSVDYKMFACKYIKKIIYEGNVS